MANVINRTTLQFIASANEPSFPEPEWKWNPDMSAVAGVAREFWKWDPLAERPIPMTGPEQAAVIAAKMTAARDATAQQLNRSEDILRAFMLLMLDELNLHAARTNAILDAVDAATSLGTLKSAVALIADVPARTAQQLITAIRGKLGA